MRGQHYKPLDSSGSRLRYVLHIITGTRWRQRKIVIINFSIIPRKKAWEGRQRKA
jgi:hypothetical protein